MSQSRPLRERKKREVLPTDPKAEEPSFGSANGWGRKQLKLLGVTFAPNAAKRLDLNKVLNVQDEDWPPEIQNSTPLLASILTGRSIMVLQTVGSCRYGSEIRSS